MDKHKNNKVFYYGKNYLRQLIPRRFFASQLQTKLNIDNLKSDQLEYVKSRLAYYNKLSRLTSLNDEAISLSSLDRQRLKTYYFDLYEYSRFFDHSLKGNFLFGDITHTPAYPSLVKSRPIVKDNANSVIMKWNKVRHFMFVRHDKIDFKDKKNLLIGRARVHPPQPHRIKFLEMYFGHPLCDIGKINKNELNPNWVVPSMTIQEQLQYKFVLCLEGNDVASNLKWVMSSGSIAVMPKPKFETWFMEGKLIPDYHYIVIKDDYSDLEEKLNYYIKHSSEAKEIVRNANEFAAQFKNKRNEDLISLLVLDKYFRKTKQYE